MNVFLFFFLLFFWGGRGGAIFNGKLTHYYSMRIYNCHTIQFNLLSLTFTTHQNAKYNTYKITNIVYKFAMFSRGVDIRKNNAPNIKYKLRYSLDRSIITIMNAALSFLAIIICAAFGHMLPTPLLVLIYRFV